jgi:hypothetical protein
MNNPDPANPNIKLSFAEKTINDFLRLEPLIQTTSPFYDLPPETILYWLQQLNLQGDSESSVFSILVQWLNKTLLVINISHNFYPISDSIKSTNIISSR